MNFMSQHPTPSYSERGGEVILRGTPRETLEKCPVCGAVYVGPYAHNCKSNEEGEGDARDSN